MRLNSRRVERVFVRDVVAILRGVHDALMSHVSPAKTDAVTPRVSIDGVMRQIMPQIGPKVSKAHTKMSNGLERNYQSTMKEILPIGFSQLPTAVQMKAQLARDESIKLVENAARVYATQVREVFNDPANNLGTRWEDLRDQLMERANVSESRAELIARDQTLKLNGAINEATQRSVGVDRYVWSTSNDERVRDEHAELEGEEFSWDSPPEPGNPGEDFQCRCIALPVIDLDGDIEE